MVDMERLMESLRFIVVEIDGIFVPFYIEQWRQKTGSTLLLTLENIHNERQASTLAAHEAYALIRELPEEASIDDTNNEELSSENEGGLYASDLIGYEVVDSHDAVLGTIVDIEDSTDNVLFILQTPTATTLYIPVVADWIEELLPDERRLKMQIPEGLVEQ